MTADRDLSQPGNPKVVLIIGLYLICTALVTSVYNGAYIRKWHSVIITWLLHGNSGLTLYSMYTSILNLDVQAYINH